MVDLTTKVDEVGQYLYMFYKDIFKLCFVTAVTAFKVTRLILFRFHEITQQFNNTINISPLNWLLLPPHCCMSGHLTFSVNTVAFVCYRIFILLYLDTFLFPSSALLILYWTFCAWACRNEILIVNVYHYSFRLIMECFKNTTF